MDISYQVFVSSTYLDLIAERQHVLFSILNARCVPAGMELFPASNEQLWDHIKRIIEESEYYLLIVKEKYGSTVKVGRKEISWTEREYDHAVDKNKPIFAFFYNPSHTKRKRRKGRRSKESRQLEKFRNKVRGSGLIPAYWDSAEKLGELVTNALTSTLTKDRPTSGWVKTDKLMGWDLIALVNRNFPSWKNDYHKIVEIYSRAKMDPKKLELGLELSEKLLAVDNLHRTREGMIGFRKKYRDGISSGFFDVDKKDHRITVKPEWGGEYELLYAMCFVHSKGLESKELYKRPLFDYHPTYDPKNWWDRPWDDVAIYASLISCNEAVSKGIRYLIQDSISKQYIDALTLAYRVVLAKSFIDNEEVHRLLEAMYSYIPSKKS